jgi:Tfp pilus assembly protein PilF
MCSSTLEKRSRILRPLFFILGLGLIGGLFGWPYLSIRLQCHQIRNLLANSEVSTALKKSQTLAANEPNCAECQFLLAKSARRSADFSAAATALEQARVAGWDSTKIHLEQILATAQSGQVRSVDRELKRIFRMDLEEEEIGEIYEALAYGHLAAFDTPEFLKSLDYWLDWRPDAVKPRLLRADLFSRIQKYSAAVDEYKALLLIHPDCVEARTNLGENLLQLNLAKEAAEQLQVSYEDQPSDRVALLLAKCLIQLDGADKAKALLLEFRNSPNEAVRSQILEELGRWHSDRNEPETAVGYLEETVRLAPESTSAWHTLSTVYAMLGRSEDAERAQTVSHTTQQRSQRLFNVVTELSAKPESIQLRLEAASILFEQKMDTDAVAWLRTILSIDVNHQEANRMLAIHYRKSGREDLAAEHIKLGKLDPLLSK